MKWMISETRRAVACGLFALFGAGLTSQAAGPTGGRAGSGSQMLTNATVVAVDAEAGRLTVRGGGIGKDQSFTVASEARRDLRAVKPGDDVALTLGAAPTGADVVTRVERSPSTTTSGGSTARREAARPATPEPVATPPLSAPVASPSTPAAPPSTTPSADKPLPTDTVGPLRDPRVNPHFDPRVSPHRDPRVVPGLSRPSPSPTT